MSRPVKDINELIPWQEISPGGEVCEGGTARLVKTCNFTAIVRSTRE